MESEGEDSISFKLSLLNIPPANMQSPLRSGLATPPLRTLASVPFKWEEEPGKPRPCTDLIILPEPAKFLELPPCRMPLMEPQPTNKSPNTVLDGPYNVGRPKFSSFRFFRETGDSFDSCSSASPESAVDVFLGKKSCAGISRGGQKGKGFFGRTLKWKGGGKKEVNNNNNNGISISSSSNSSCDSDDQSCSKVKIDGKMRRNGSFSNVSHVNSTTTHIWASIYQGFKQVMPWKSAKK